MGRRNPRFVFRGVHGLIPTTEPAKIVGLTGKKREFICKVAGYTIYHMDGKHIRAQWSDFIGGGHHAAYRFIPKGDIWIDSTVREWGGFLASHELLEALLMDLRDWSYQRAHGAANALEQELRGYAEYKALSGPIVADVWFAHLTSLFPKGEAQRTVADTVGRLLWRFL